ncbi:hypothetical protein [Nonomuraea turkmeniaca]|uniref:hypothetical protein n=1 Tax=Nonomuraea turkmeniaca TaxID=103838 RepID=UPI001B86E45F|nr:hypothetical protein [Nonomuraea turkmeniaca]
MDWLTGITGRDGVEEEYIKNTGAVLGGVMALTGALSLSLFAVTGFTNKTLRGLVTRLLGTPYTASQMTYDLRRLAGKGLIRRLGHSHTYVLTPDGQRIAIFYSKHTIGYYAHCRCRPATRPSRPPPRPRHHRPPRRRTSSPEPDSARPPAQPPDQLHNLSHFGLMC